MGPCNWSHTLPHVYIGVVPGILHCSHAIPHRHIGLIHGYVAVVHGTLKCATSPAQWACFYGPWVISSFTSLPCGHALEVHGTLKWYTEKAHGTLSCSFIIPHGHAGLIHGIFLLSPGLPHGHVSISPHDLPNVTWPTPWAYIHFQWGIATFTDTTPWAYQNNPWGIPTVTWATP